MRIALLAPAVYATTAVAQPTTAPSHRVTSPDGKNVVSIETRSGGLFYSVDRSGRRVILPSRLGFEFRGARPLRDSLRIVGSSRRRRTRRGCCRVRARVREHYNELRVQVGETVAPQRHFTVVVRAFDDGVGFRYELADSAGFRDFEMMEELTEFTVADDARAWWIRANQPQPDRYEQLYVSTPVSKIDTAHTPLTLELQNGIRAVIHEADLVDYAGMNLAGQFERRTLRVTLPPWADGVRVRGRAPFVTPWRTIQLADRAEDLAPSVLTLKLNPPSRIADATPYRPMKYVGSGGACT